ncbi:MAG: chemotaxis protein CheW [Magnetococcales bacterium]|nr:chemotaxis protein CheW [Magnetococcales bacterium]MBF0114237.1 chemotaxis protein CheW [Magnetococcales bacterium]
MASQEEYEESQEAAEGEGQEGRRKKREDDNALREGNQLVTFFLNDEVFAFPVTSVQEIIRVPEMVHVPLSPPSLQGLANLRGTLLPVVGLRSLFGMNAAEHAEDTRVIVVDVGTSVGFVVDRVSRVVTVEQDKVEGIAGIQSTINTDVLTGVVKDVGGHAMVMLLDVRRLVNQEFAATRKQATTAGGGQGMRSSRSGLADDADAGGSDEMQLVSFVVNKQEYAFPIDRVEEIVRVPEEISQVPKSASHVLGIINLRNRLLPLVSLREMFHFRQPDLTEHNRIVVISLEGSGGGTRRHSVGIVTDQVKEVIRVSKRLADEVPALLSSGNNGVKDVSAICRMDDGKRLISVLDVESLFQHNAIKEALSVQQGSAAEGESAVSVAETGHRQEEDVQLVVFRLLEEEYGVQIESVQEIIRVPEQLTAVPKTPTFIEGMLNLRGAVLPVVDLRRRLNLHPMERNDRQRIVVFTLAGIQTGFIVDSVAEVLKLSNRIIEEAPDLSSDQKRIMGRVANLEAKKRMILILEAEQLLDEEQRQAVRKIRKNAA